MRLLKRDGQSMGEYAVLFAIVLGAVVGLQGFVRERLRAKVVGAATTYEQAGVGTTSTQGGISTSDSQSEQLFTTVDQGTVSTDTASHQQF